MSEHYPKSTETVTAWCKKCVRATEHRVDVGRIGPCIDPKHPQPLTVKRPARPKPGELFT